MLSQDGIDENTPLGATLSRDGATFKVWAPLAKAVYLNGLFGGAEFEKQTEARLLARDPFGFWTGFQAGARDGDRYRYFVIGEGSADYKRDPTARELDPARLNAYAILRGASTYPWHDADFVTPDFSAMIVYQAHIGTFATRAEGRSSNLLEAACLAPYLARLGVNVLQPLPADRGGRGVDLFSPDFPYVASAEEVERLAPQIDAILAAKGFGPLPAGALHSAHNQLKALVDLCHIHGIAVVFDVDGNVGGLVDGADASDSLASAVRDSGVAFAAWKDQVRRFLHENARFYADEVHADGLRYDEIGILLSADRADEWVFCRDYTKRLRSRWPSFLQDPNFWTGAAFDASDGALPIVAPVTTGGEGLDVVQHDVLRSRIRDAIHAASYTGHGPLPMSGVAAALSRFGFDRPWRTVTSVENHELAHIGRQQRIAALADSANRRSWYARSRARVAMGLLLTAPGIPQLFMGQEFLEDKQWTPEGDNLLWWEGFEGADKAMSDHWRCTADLIALRRQYEALRGDQVNAYYVHDNDRILAFHRWIEAVGEDVVVVVSLAEFTRYDYRLGMPGAGVWREVFNSDAYDNLPNPWVAGNGGAVAADGPPMHGLPASAAFVIPANSVLVLTR